MAEPVRVEYVVSTWQRLFGTLLYSMFTVGVPCIEYILYLRLVVGQSVAVEEAAALRGVPVQVDVPKSVGSK